MRHHLNTPAASFVREPDAFSRETPREVLQYCLGATLYMPGTKDVAPKLLQGGITDVTSMVLCCEDAVAAENLASAENNILTMLDTLQAQCNQVPGFADNLPLIFVRVRSIQQFEGFSRRMTPEQATALCGFVFPKFYSHSGNQFLDILADLNRQFDAHLYAMPILEGREIAFRETRLDELLGLSKLLANYRDMILNIRIGGTDFSSLFGVRRGINSSIYEILVVRDCLSDILNVFGRDQDGYVISAPVWEYFLAYKQDDINLLVEQDIHRSILTKTPIVNEAIDGLLQEVLMDKVNGFIGKTIIHPSHARFVNAFQAVTREEYEDAIQILGCSGGVLKSAKNNKMNEMNPHRSWARRVDARAKAFGVIENETAYVKLLSQATNPVNR